MYYFIINPRSQSGHGKEVWNILKNRMKTSQKPYQAFFTKYTGHASVLAQELAALQIPCTLTVVGGDGTLNEVINGLVSTDYSHITLGYIPAGSGNDFARGLRLSPDPAEALEHILNPSSIRLLDIGMAKAGNRSRAFLISAGMGFDASICYEALRSKMKKLLNHLHLGKITYILLALKQLFLYQPSSLSLRIDKKTIYRYKKCYFAAVMNLPYEGGGCNFCPEAVPYDHRLNLCVAEHLTRLKILFLLPIAYLGKHEGFQGVHLKQGLTFEYISSKALPIHCDGESLGFHKRLSVKLLAKQIFFISG